MVLIETYWECKWGESVTDLNTQLGLNRNILECKCQNERFKTGIKIVLIETYWNVNDPTLIFRIQFIGVLIETYWNVNLVNDPVRF